MARKNHSPEDFIREHIARGCTAEEIISRAQKRDKGFLNIVKETLQHTTLIEKIENQVNNHQGQLNFEDGNYSSDAIKRQIAEQKNNKSKNKHNGRSNLPINTDIQMDDLEAPLQTLQREEKKVSFKTKPNKKSPLEYDNNLSLFDEIIPQQPQNENKAYDLKTEEFPITPAHSQAKIEMPPIAEKSHSFQSTQDEIASIQKELVKKDKLITDLNKNLGSKEAEIYSIRVISENKKTKLLKDITRLKRKCFAFQTGFVSVCFLFCISIGFSYLKTSPNNTTPYQTTIADSNTETEVKQDLNQLLVEDNNTQLVQIEPTSHEETYQQPDSRLPISAPSIVLDPIADTPRPISSQTHTVKNGDNWWKITKKYWGNENAHKYKKIVEYNRLRSENLKQGQVLKIPALAELD